MSKERYEFKFLDVDDALLAGLDLSGFPNMKYHPLWDYKYLSGLFSAEGKPVSLLALSVNKGQNSFFMRYVENDPNYEGQQNVTRLLRETFNFIAENFENASFTVEGFSGAGEASKIDQKIERVGAEFPNIALTIKPNYF